MVAVFAIGCGDGSSTSGGTTPHGLDGAISMDAMIGTGGTAPIVLAESPCSARQMAVDATSVYWSCSAAGTGNGAILKVPIEGGMTTTLESPNGTDSIAVSATDVYWVTYDHSTIERTPINGGMSTTVVSGYIGSLVVDDKFLYWIGTPSPYGDASAVMKIPLEPRPDGGADAVPQQLTGVVSGGPIAMTLDRDAVYWTSSFDGTVMKVPINGGAPTTLATGQNSPCLIGVNADGIYWVNCDDSTVMKVPHEGGVPVTLATDEQTPILAMAVDDASVYWITSPDPRVSLWGHLRKVSTRGGASSTVLENDAFLDIAVDATSVYWISGYVKKLTPK